MEKYDVVVIGGGPGGYPAAIRSAQLGLRVAIVEIRDRFGGECTLYGCIPTKSLIKFSGIYWGARTSSFIKNRESIDADFTEIMRRTNEIVSKISSGIEYLLKSYGVDIYRGRAEIREDKSIVISNETILRADKIIVATGTDPVIPSEYRVFEKYLLDNRSVLSLREKPSSLIIIGGGYVGIEFATFLSRLGVEINVVEMMPNILPGIDVDASRLIEKKLVSMGVKIHKNTVVKELREVNGEIEAKLSSGETVRGEKILVAIGRAPNTRDIGLERVGVELSDRGYVKVDDHMRTSNPSIYASGDVAGPPLLAHKAFIQAYVAAENASGREAGYSKIAIPSVVFSDPEIAQVGYTVEEARKKGFEPVAYRLFLGGVARAVIEDAETGFIKLVIDKSSKKILGGVIVSPHASELISVLSLAIELGLSTRDLGEAIYPHPTLSEIYKEIIDYIEEKSTHYFIKKRSL